MKENFNFTEIPKQKDLYPDILLALHSAGGSATKREVIDILADKLSLTEGQLNMKTKDGNETQLVSNITFARMPLVYTGYISNEIRGTWLLSTKGKEAVKNLIDEKKENRVAFVEKVLKELKPILQEFAKKKKRTILSEKYISIRRGRGTISLRRATAQRSKQN